MSEDEAVTVEEEEPESGAGLERLAQRRMELTIDPVAMRRLVSKGLNEYVLKGRTEHTRDWIVKSVWQKADGSFRIELAHWLGRPSSASKPRSTCS